MLAAPDDAREDLMPGTRRDILGGVAVTALGTVAAAAPATANAPDAVPAARIARLFADLPGTVAYRILAPATRRTRRLELASNAGRRLFVGSAFKTFVAAEAFRQADSPEVVQRITARQLALDASVWSLDSATFNPPHLEGAVSERTALEAMILHSDNTGTDMVLKAVGPGRVRAFIASAGLTKTLIPDSTRAFFGYLLGAPDYLTFTWKQLVAAIDGPIVNPPLNTTQTLASSADDLVSFYRRALQGEFFRHQETLRQYRALLSIGDVINLVPFPLGASSFAKGGSIDVPGFHALCVPGGMFFDDVWVYFCFTINWRAAAEQDPATVAAFAAATGKALQIVKDSLAA